MKYNRLDTCTTVSGHNNDATKIALKSGCVFNDRGEDDANITETASVQKSADLLGGFEQKRPSSELRAIRSKCLACSNDSPKEVRLCELQGCPLWAYRMGKRPKKPSANTETH